MPRARHLVVARKLTGNGRRKHPCALSWVIVLVVAVNIEGQLHFSGHYKIVSVLHTHFSETLGFSRNWFFALDVDVHLAVLDELPELKVLDVGENGLLENLESLVGAYLNLKTFVQLVIELGSLYSYVEVQTPSFLFSVGPSLVLTSHS